MEYFHLLEIPSHHCRLSRGKSWVLHSILLRRCRQISFYQMECNPTAHFWSTFVYSYLNELVYYFQICLWRWYRYRIATICNIHVRMHTQLEQSHNLNKIKNLLVLRLFSDLCPRMGIPVHSQMEDFTVSNLHPRSICFMGAHKSRKVKSSLFMGSEENLISQLTFKLYGLIERKKTYPQGRDQILN